MEVVRFAPSPTGYLHLGHAYSAWFSFRAALGGRFLLRIEDIDQGRSRPEFVSAIYEDLGWLGLTWEEPVRVQSEHFDDYSSALDKLTDLSDLTYPCFYTRADIRAAVTAPHGQDGPVYPGTCRWLSAAEREDRIASGDPYALRLDVARAVERVGELPWHDRTAGEQVAKPELFGDVVLARKETPTSYHLSVVVDDALQGITLVTRGTDLFDATHVHRLLQALLDLPTPEYWHHPLVLEDHGEKMAKRDGSESIRSYREKGESKGSLMSRFDSLLDPG
ncbi:MAG: tRNA glutamyl-Q(34) synthetase GluQRS [Armatimonadetes bacterium]|nr:tRNA glutamyl-Q(34) synthetase GluQRS [Armatimonadota bacterium]